MKQYVVKELVEYFSNKEVLNEKEEWFLSEAKDLVEFFPITYISREDLRSSNFDTSDVSDETMERLATRMENHYCQLMFWDDVSYLAENTFQIPRLNNHPCPECDGTNTYLDHSEGIYNCNDCGFEWEPEEQ